MQEEQLQNTSLNFKEILKLQYIVYGLACFVFEYIFYSVAKIIPKPIPALMIKIPAIDNRISYTPVFFPVYYFSYFFWIIGFAAIAAAQNRKNLMDFTAGFAMSVIIGAVFFIALPTVSDRVADGVYSYNYKSELIKFLSDLCFKFDSASNPFPSFHCMMSTFCYMGIRKNGKISKAFKIYTLIMMILIFLSTVLTKQHYVADIAGGVIIPIICCSAVKKINPSAVKAKG